MELYNRLINEGVFIFWSDLEHSDKYTVKLYIFVGEKKIALFEEELPGNRHSFSVDKLGSGDYLIEVHSFKNGRLKETVDKKVNLSSTIQKLAELKDAIEEITLSMESIKDEVEGVRLEVSHLNTCTSSSFEDILDIMRYPHQFLDDFLDNWAIFLNRLSRRRRDD